jgi:hypothetical protein
VQNTPASIPDVILSGEICVFKSAVYAYFHKEMSLQLEMLTYRESSCHILTHFSEGNNMLETAASKLDGILPRDT